MVVADSGGGVSSRFACSIHIELAKDLWILLDRAVVVHHEEHVASQQPYMDERCPAEKAHHLPVEEMLVAQVNLCNVAGKVYFTLQKHQM